MDDCSRWAYKEIMASGYVGRIQGLYLSVFVDAGEPLTAKQAVLQVVERMGLSALGKDDKWAQHRNSHLEWTPRLSELEQMGFIQKYDIVECEITGKRVNRWIYTGSRKPLPFHIVDKSCPRCKGHGFVKVKEYTNLK